VLCKHGLALWLQPASLSTAGEEQAGNKKRASKLNKAGKKRFIPPPMEHLDNGQVQRPPAQVQQGQLVHLPG